MSTSVVDVTFLDKYTAYFSIKYKKKGKQSWQL